MYGRVISCTLRAPSLWSILDVAAKVIPQEFARQILSLEITLATWSKLFLPKIRLEKILISCRACKA